MMSSAREYLLGGSMVMLELLAGMQTYVTSTVTPLLAAELGGTHLYGRAMAAVQAAIFLTLPLSVGLIRRWSGARVLTWLTPVTVLAAVAAACAPSMESYIAARFIGALASGAMAGVGMGIIATHLHGRVRQLVLAAMSAMWVLSSLLGPVYAAWLSSAFSWRWALVAYLPLLVSARWVIVRELRGMEAPGSEDGGLPVGGAALLASGVLLLGLRPPVDWLGITITLGAVVGVVIGAVHVLPGPVLDLGTRGSPAAVRLLCWLSLAHFGADGVIAIVAHDLLGFDATRLGALLMVGGLSWALLGVATGAWPAGPLRVRWQFPLGLGTVMTGLVLVAWGSTGASGWLWVGWTMVNLGMGMVYLDCLNLVFGAAPQPGLDPANAGMAVVVVESLAGSVAGTLAASVLSGRPNLAWLVFLALACGVVPALFEVGHAVGGERASITS